MVKKRTFLCNAWLIVYVAASKHVCNELPCEEEDPRSDLNLLQTQVAVQAAETECPLPTNARWCTIHLGSVNLVMAVYQEHCLLSDSICEYGTWELTENDLSTFGPPGHALDIGTHVGFYSLVLAAMGWKVSSFEPIVANVNLLRASLCRNPLLSNLVQIHNVGLGVKSEHCIVVSSDSNLGDGISKCGKEATDWVDGHFGDYHKRGDMEIRRLDDILAGDKIQSVDFVKMDVEGFECEVMKGGQSLMQKYRPRFIQSEVWSHMQRGCEPNDYLASFDKAGYIVSSNKQCTDTALTITAGVDVDERYMCRHV